MTSAVLCSKTGVILLFQGAVYAGHTGWWKGGDRLIWTQFEARTLVVKGGCHLSSDSRHPALESWLSWGQETAREKPQNLPPPNPAPGKLCALYNQALEDEEFSNQKHDELEFQH